MRAVQTELNLVSVKVSNYYNLALFIFLTAGFGFLLLERAWGRSHPPLVKIGDGDRPKKAWFIISLQIALSLWLFARTSHEIFDGPLDTDETYISSEFSQPHPWSVIDPRLSTRNHGLSTLAGFFSSRVFGLNEMTIRYPSLFFTALFLLLLNLYCFRYASAFTTLLIFGHLCVNQLALWYLHSMRGYVAMMALTLGILYLSTRILESKTQVSWLRLSLLTAVAALAAVTHTFGGFFVVCFALALILWLSFPRDDREVDATKATRVFIALGLAIPFVVALVLCQAKAIKALGLFNTGKVPDLSFETIRVLGIPHAEWARFAWLLVVVLALYPFSRRKRFVPSLASCLLLASATIIFGLVWSLQVVILEGRMLLALLIPFLLWVGTAIQNVEERPLRYALMGYGVLVLVFAPLPGRPELYNVTPEILSDYKNFIRKVREVTEPNGPACFTTSGAPWAVKWTEGLYLADRMASKATECRSHYHLYFASDDPTQKLTRPPGDSFQLLFIDGEGRTLYRRIL
jgi:hypothetical protein